MFTESAVLIALVACSIPPTAGGDKLRLTVEPVKRDNILYEPVVVRVSLENRGTRPFPVSTIWLDVPDTMVWYSAALDIRFAAVSADSVRDEEEAPSDNEFQSIPRLQSGDYSPGIATRKLIPRGRRTHYHPLVWKYNYPDHPENLSAAEYMISEPGTLWIKAVFRHYGLQLESKEVPIRFHAVPQNEKEPAELWTQRSVAWGLQFGVDLSETKLSGDEIRQLLRDFARRFPESVYASYARAMLDTSLEPSQWAEAYFKEARPETPMIELTLDVPKHRYLFAEPFLVAAEIKNVSDEPVRIDPRLEYEHGWLKLYRTSQMREERPRRLSEMDGVNHLPHYTQPAHLAPTDWQPVTLKPGESRRQVFFFPYDITRTDAHHQWIWGEYRGGPGGFAQSEPIQVELIGSCRGNLGQGIEFARAAIIEGVPKEEIEPLILWISEVNVTRFLETGNPREIPDRPSGRAILEELIQKHPHSLYAFYARAALEHPDDWAERLMNDPETVWPQVTDPQRMARLGLFFTLGGVLVILLFATLLARRRRVGRGMVARSTSAGASV